MYVGTYLRMSQPRINQPFNFHMRSPNLSMSLLLAHHSFTIFRNTSHADRHVHYSLHTYFLLRMHLHAQPISYITSVFKCFNIFISITCK